MKKMILIFFCSSLLFAHIPYKIGKPVLLNDPGFSLVKLTYQDWCIQGYVWRVINERYPGGMSQVMEEKNSQIHLKKCEKK